MKCVLLRAYVSSGLVYRILSILYANASLLLASFARTLAHNCPRQALVAMESANRRVESCGFRNRVKDQERILT